MMSRDALGICPFLFAGKIESDLVQMAITRFVGTYAMNNFTQFPVNLACISMLEGTIAVSVKDLQSSETVVGPTTSKLPTQRPERDPAELATKETLAIQENRAGERQTAETQGAEWREGEVVGP